MQDYKPILSPLSITDSFYLNDGNPPIDAKLFRQIVGALQYLSHTQLDVCFVVYKLPQFMHQPTEQHWHAMKRVLHYLQGTISYGLRLYGCTPLSLHAFADADWAVNSDTRTSTSAYITFLGANL